MKKIAESPNPSRQELASSLKKLARRITARGSDLGDLIYDLKDAVESAGIYATQDALKELKKERLKGEQKDLIDDLMKQGWDAVNEMWNTFHLCEETEDELADLELES